MRKVTNGKSKNGLGKLTLGPYPASKKVYLKGNIFPEIKVPDNRDSFENLSQMLLSVSKDIKSIPDNSLFILMI